MVFSKEGSEVYHRSAAHKPSFSLSLPLGPEGLQRQGCFDPFYALAHILSSKQGLAIDIAQCCVKLVSKFKSVCVRNTFTIQYGYYSIFIAISENFYFRYL